jgi:hypothetical protein
MTMHEAQSSPHFEPVEGLVQIAFPLVGPAASATHWRPRRSPRTDPQRFAAETLFPSSRP